MRADRRRFLAAGTVLGLTAFVPASAFCGDARRYRVAVIGHTGRGNYGHGLDTVWADLPNTEVVAVADADPKGLAEAVKRLGQPRGFGDYRAMLDEVKPDLVAVGPRWVDQHRDMVLAAAAAGARGILLEKPLCRTLAEADEMVAVCERQGVQVAVAHQTRYSPKIPVLRQLLASGQLGRLLTIRGRGKDDHRGGGEDLVVLGSHIFDLMNLWAGPPEWCTARVFQEGHPITRRDVQPGNEGIGPLAGDAVHALYGLADQVTAAFDSVRGAGANPTRFGITLYGTQGVLELGFGYLPSAYFLPDPSWSPGQSKKAWLPVSSAGVDQPEPLADGGLPAGNRLIAQDLIAAIEQNRPPQAGLREARTALEMIWAVFESQRLGTTVPFPLATRQNPLELL